MKILCIADEEYKTYWDFFSKDDFKDIDLIISCGDLKASYLSFLTTMTSIPVLYIRGNHDDSYKTDPPQGCICIEDDIFSFQGVRILGLGGSQRYKQGINQYTEREMRKRITKLKFKLWFHRGFDILVTHSPARGFHDGTDLCHQGFQVFLTLIDKYRPKYFVHGHVHLSYGRQFQREDMIGDTKVINAYEKYIIEI
ncbi:metallophosphoesterase [Roseburia sp. MUC/MUC-530-WT-4D]|uniref:Metallophosphoesterase n=1 Tax=Roseburia porci TaxID=2605790 RepID=A0A6L5YUB0_9FIRM|nr:metallophosphoesterase [Roseburia porci]MCI5517651.1 metallophosphoesterase [Roseburia sp.]MDD6743283.1 metallophosphoesterase [Roseburia porci]MST75301.1 metallophosphoesterase [Roseburia porci]